VRSVTEVGFLRDGRLAGHGFEVGGIFGRAGQAGFAPIGGLTAEDCRCFSSMVLPIDHARPMMIVREFEQVLIRS